MPTIAMERDELLRRIGSDKLTNSGLEGFEQICFDFGIELDEVTTKKEYGKSKTNSPDDCVIYKIDIPANRYDLLCLEGLARALHSISRTS